MNVSYRRFKSSDFANLNFIVDILSFLLQNFNPINLDRKVDLEDERFMIKFLWENCLPADFTRLIYTTPIYQAVADPRLTYQKANQIVLNCFISYERKNEVSEKIRENFNHIHFIYSTLFPKIYNRINQFGIQNKSEFELAFSLWKVNKQIKNDRSQQSIKSYFHPAKDPSVYKEREQINENEQKPQMWSLGVKNVSPSVTTTNKAKEQMDKKTNEKKAELKRRLDENTEKMEQIKKMKMNSSSKKLKIK